MNFLRKTSKFSYFIIGILFFVILSVTPYFFGPGLTQAEPVGTFLNGNFPDVTASNDPYQPAFPNLTFDSPLTFITVPNSDLLVVGQRNGEIYVFPNDDAVLETDKKLFADLSNEVGVVWDGGFLGLEIHPEFGTPGNNYVYTYYTSKDGDENNPIEEPNSFESPFGCYQEDWWGGFLYLRRYEVDLNTFTVDVATELTMLKLRMFSSTHRGGALEFGDDGFLYLTTGEQSAYTKSQNITTNLDGGVLRLDVNQDPAKSHDPIRKLDTGRFADEISGVGYGIPNDNPFLSPTGDNFEEYYTIGHRNPHRMTKDALTGILYIGEVGAGTHEEINIVSAGKNYGWPVYEGNIAGPGANCGGPDSGMYNNMPHENPLLAFPRADANAVMGGYVYRGASMPEFYGKYICADYGVGEEIWAVDIETGAYDLITAFSPTNIISFGEDNTGELYLLSQGDGVSLYRLTSVNGSPLDGVPQLLSETGAFEEDLSTLTPNPGLIPYDLVESFWSDGAEKKRWMVIPNDGTHDTAQEKISFSEDGDWDFPVGSVLIKHFEMPIDDTNPNITKRLETRFAVKASSGNFYFLTYKWNDQGTDAVFLGSGLNENIEIATTGGGIRNQTWTYPGTQDCISCHNPVTKGTLGPRTRFLNSNITYPQTSINANQLVTLSHIGILDVPIDDNTVLGYQTHKAIDDPNATLDEKARSYLDNNCAYCHRPGGTGDRAQFDLRLSNTLVQTGLMYAGTNTPINGLDKIVIAGDAANSILFHRTESVDPSVAMPPIAKNVGDQLGIDLIEAWINQLDPNFEDPTIHTGTYIVTNVGSGLVMDIAGVSQDNHADVHQWGYVTGENQQFIVAPDGNNFYTLKAVHSNKNIDVEAQGQAPGTNVIQYQENGTAAQLFSFEYLGNNQFAIKSKANNLYLGIEGNSTVNGGSIKTYVNDGSDFFKWTFAELTIPVVGVTVAPSSTIFEGENLALSATVLPNNATEQGVTWSSSDDTIATVDASGIVTGVAEGVVTITATTVEGAFTDTADITVISIDCNGTMIDHTDPVGTGVITARAEINEAENRFKAFDNKDTLENFSKWLDNGGNPTEIDPSFISIEFDSPKWVNTLVITSANDDYGRDPVDFKILGSNGGGFIELSSWSGVQFSQRFQSKDFLFANDTAYTTYRLEITKNDGSNEGMTQLAEIKLIGCDVPPSVTYTYNNGWLPSDPIGVATLNDQFVVETGEAVITANTISNTIEVDPGAALRVDPGVVLTASSTTLNSFGDMYSSLIVNGTIEGTINYKRFVNANINANDLVSPPLSGQAWADFLGSDDNESDLINDGNSNPRAYLFGPFDKTADSYIQYTDATSATLVSGIGYRAGTVPTDPDNGTNLTFTGTVLTTQVTVDIINSGAVYASWNLIGNPYPSYISIAEFLNYETSSSPTPIRNIDILEDISGIYGYDGDTSDGWDVITLANAGSRLMAPGQGFFVAADAADVAAYDVTFDLSMRIIGAADDFIPGRSVSNPLSFIKLKASTDTKEYSTEFYFNEKASKGLDLGYDGKILGDTAPRFALYSHLVEDNEGLPIALQALHPSDLEDIIIPLGVNSNQGEQLSFSIKESTLSNEVEVYLEDRHANTVTLLTSGDYTLTPNVELEGTDRFYLRISSSTLSVVPNAFDYIQIYTIAQPKALIIKGALETSTTLNLYDIQGRLVLKDELNQFSTENRVDVSTIETGVYFAKVFNANQSKTQKLIIR